MAREGWYNENEYRDYPFITRVMPLDAVALECSLISSSSSSSAGIVLTAEPVALVDLPHEAIVDFGAIMAIDSEYDVSLHKVWLARITRSGVCLVYEFKTNAPGAAGEVLRFVRDINDTEFKQQWATSVPAATPDPVCPASYPSSSSSSVSGSQVSSSSSSSSNGSCYETREFTCVDAAKWEGFLVTGLFGDLVDTLGDGDSMIFADCLWIVEPARIQSLVNTYVRTVNLANRARVVATPPLACLSGSSSSLAEPDLDFIINRVCMSGKLAFKEGYNANIRQVAAENKLVFGAGVGDGLGTQCNEVQITPCEEPTDGPYLTGGDTCGETVRAINGVGGRNITIFPGPGFTVTEDLPNTVIIGADLHGFAVCLPQSSVSSSSVPFMESSCSVSLPSAGCIDEASADMNHTNSPGSQTYTGYWFPDFGGQFSVEAANIVSESSIGIDDPDGIITSVSFVTIGNLRGVDVIASGASGEAVLDWYWNGVHFTLSVSAGLG